MRWPWLFRLFAYNVAGVQIAAGLLYPFTGMLLSPVVAAAAMALSSVSRPHAQQQRRHGRKGLWHERFQFMG